MNALEISNLTFSYPEQPVLTGVDLTIQAGERVGLIGPNGAGKTTLFHSVCGVLKPNSGTINLFGNTVVLRVCRKHVAFADVTNYLARHLAHQCNRLAC